MKELLARFFEKEHIAAYAAIPLAQATVTRPYLLDCLDFAPQTAIIFLVPYYAGDTENLSRYAAARDYHLYMKGLFARFSAALDEVGSSYRAAAFSDHSPIDERDAAARAGLGILGDNGLIIHPIYGSFVFIGELLADAPPDACGAVSTRAPAHCEGCGACRAACPTGILRGAGAKCLSAITQQKASLTQEEETLIRSHHTVWGCDTCQSVCPHNIHAIEEGTANTPISFFEEERLPHISHAHLHAMSDEDFAARAFSFRGRKVLERNLDILYPRDKTKQIDT